MSESPQMLTGIVHGNLIQFDQPVGLPDGQSVEVQVRPSLAPTPEQREHLERAFGGWAEDAEELDRFMEDVRAGRRGR